MRQVFDIKDDNSNLPEAFPYEQLKKLTKLDAMIWEVLRLRSPVFITRKVMDHNVKFQGVSSGEEFNLRKGDILVAYSPPLHYDPEIFDDPLSFKHNRSVISYIYIYIYIFYIYIVLYLYIYLYIFLIYLYISDIY